MRIGVSSKVMARNRWRWELNKIPFKTLEINLRNSNFPFNQPEEIKKALKNYDISFHSRPSFLFMDNKIINKAEKATLEADAYTAGIFKTKLIFHISKQPKRIEYEFLNKLTNTYQAKLTIENSRKEYLSKAEHALTLIEKTPKLGFCLDVGHLKIAEQLGYVKDKLEFIKQMRKYTKYVHLHDTLDEYDTHTTFELTPENKEILKEILKAKPQKIIIETKFLKEAIKTLKNIKKYVQ